MLAGYMRVSSDGDRQTTALQRDALLAAGVDDRHLYEDRASGVRRRRCAPQASTTPERPCVGSLFRCYSEPYR